MPMMTLLRVLTAACTEPGKPHETVELLHCLSKKWGTAGFPVFAGDIIVKGKKYEK